jgi:hypothetical protein
MKRFGFTSALGIEKELHDRNHWFQLPRRRFDAG